MAITGIDTIEGKQIIAAGAVSAKSAEMAYNDENGNPITGYQIAGDYLTTADSAEFYTTANESGFITGVDLTPYMLTANMTAYQTAGSYLSSTDSANFYTTANESGFITGVGDTYLQNTDLSTTDGKVTAISGIPLSAGGDVPEGVMVESGLEYNAVNEISGYNGSAIAQYGAEKQWLVHDDTLVHASNSAQYALGVNVSALKRLMGIDETVLWAGVVSGVNIPIVLNEPLNNFNKVKFKLSMDNCSNEIVYDDFVNSRTHYGLTLNNISNSVVYMNWLKLSANSAHDTIAITATKNVEWNSTNTATAPTQSRVNWEWTCRALTAIYGIGRKA